MLPMMVDKVEAEMCKAIYLGNELGNRCKKMKLVGGVHQNFRPIIIPTKITAITPFFMLYEDKESQVPTQVFTFYATSFSVTI